MKQEIITPNDFVKLPLSEAIEMVIEDVKNWKHTIDMDTWWKTNGRCSACLGGIAILSFHTSSERKKMLKYEYPDDAEDSLYPQNINAVNKISEVFNSLRRGFLQPTFEYWYNVNSDWMAYKSDLQSLRGYDFVGKTNKAELIEYLKKVALFFKKHNY